jgi:alpha-tubulin suppressor-like RCC1 family protein
MTKLFTQRALSVTLPLVLTAAFVGVAARADQNEASPAAPVTAAAEARIAVGGLHACGVLADKTVQCWGSNDHGQLGNGTIVTSTDPVAVTGLSNVTAITAGNAHTCALVDDASGNGTGTVKCWGLAANGQVGDGTVGDKQADLTKSPIRRTPVTVVKDALNTALSSVVAVAAGGFHTCAITKTVGTGATQVWCWGDDGAGQLGDGQPGDRALGAQVVPGVTNVRSLALGEFHSCALLFDGTVKCWGANSFGQLALDPTTTKSSAAPVAIAGLPAPSNTDPQVLAITTGYGHVCVLLKDNTAKCWGENSFGELGYKTDYDKPASDDYQAIEPKKTMKPSTTPKTVRHNNATPTALDPTAEDLVDQGNIIAISAGQFHTCALLSGGSARCWGQNGRGQLGSDPYPFSSNGAELEDTVFAAAVQGLSSASAITAGGFETCAVAGAGLKCWGYNFYGQLGSSAPGSALPVQVTAVAGATQVAAGTGFACALINAEAMNKPVCWGDNSDGRLGSGLAVPKTSIRTAVTGIASASALNAGNGHACAIPTGSTSPQCWGFNGTGQVGDGTTMSRSTPVAVSGLTTATMIDAGGALGTAERGHTCAVTSDKKVSCWGRNGNGQLGVEEAGGTLADHSTPVVVQYDSNPALPDTDPSNVTLADLDNVTAVVTGGFHSCALRGDGTAWCWGANSSGQLGNGLITDSHHAVEVQKDDSDLTTNNPLTDVTALTAGAEFTCAILNTGSAKCWGANGHGQLGDGSTTDRHVPAQVSGLDGTAFPASHAARLSAADDHTCAIRGDQGLVCWGNGSDGEIGDGSMSDRNTPAGVVNMGPPPSGVTDIGPFIKSLSVSRQNTCVVLIDTTVYCWGDNAHDQLGDGIGATSVAPRSVNLAGSF